MKNILGIVAEYNPLHNGHLYHIKKSKEMAKADFAIAVISGNFTQRGGASTISKWEKARMALQCGIDLVIELPTLYSISSAENFADGGVKILNNLGCTHISFGTETSDLKDIEKIADLLYDEPKELSLKIKNEIKKGISYPKARENAICNFLKDDRYSKILSEPNNILAIEYFKSIKKNKFNILPIAIQRKNSEYHSTKINNNFSSSTGIRKLITEGNLKKIKETMPKACYEILVDNIKNGTYINDIREFEKLIIMCIRNMDLKDIEELPEVSEGLENLIYKASRRTNNLTELIKLIKSKRYTETKINRILLYALLGIKKENMQILNNTNPYIRVLGMNSKGESLIPEINKNNTVITSVKKFEEKNKEKSYEKMLNIDKKATNIYTLGFKSNSIGDLDYTTRVVNMKKLL